MSLRTWALILIDVACLSRIAVVAHGHHADLAWAIANWWLFLPFVSY